MAFTNDAGLNPPVRGNTRFLEGTAGGTGIKFGSVVQFDSGNDDHDSMVATAATGATGIMGVVTSQGDPNNSGLFATGDNFSVQTQDFAQVLVLGSASYDKTDMLIASATKGVAKKRESETGLMDVIGYPVQKVTTGTASQLISVRLNLHKISL